MEERVILKSQRYGAWKVCLVCFILAICAYSGWFLWMPKWIRCYSEEYIRYYGMGDALLPIALLICPFAIFALIFYLAVAKTDLTVTNKRVYGKSIFGKRVDLPLDMISAVGTSIFKGVAVSTASGSIKFLMVKNRDEIHAEISKLLLDRQSNNVTHNEPIVKQEESHTNLDELKKLKDLLDAGVITQEEFEAKKRQLLGL